MSQGKCWVKEMFRSKKLKGKKKLGQKKNFVKKMYGPQNCRLGAWDAFQQFDLERNNTNLCFHFASLNLPMVQSVAIIETS